MQRVAAPTVLAQHEGPHSGFACHAPGEVEPDLVPRPDPVAGQQVVHPLVIHDREIAPLRQVEPEHAHRPVPHPIHRTIVLEVAEGQDQHGVARDDAGGRRFGAEPREPQRGHDGQRGHCARGHASAAGEPNGTRLGRRDQRMAHLLTARPSIGGILLERAHHRRRQMRRHPGTSPVDGHGSLGDVLRDHHPVGPEEGRLSGERLVGHNAEAIEIAPPIHRLARRLLGAHVGGRADRDPLPSRRGRGNAAAGRARDPEIGEQCTAGGRVQQDILRLHVAMDEPGLVRGPKRCCDVGHDALHLVGRERTLAVEPLAEALAGYLVHHVVKDPAGGPGMVDCDDVGVANAGEHARFGEKALCDRRMSGELWVDDFHRDSAVEGQVGGLKDHAHTPATKLALKPVLRPERILERAEEVEDGLAHDTSRWWQAGHLHLRDALSRQRVASAWQTRSLNPD